MGLSRRDFLRASGSAMAGTALGGLLALDVDLGPATARAQALRIQDATTTPSICPYCSVGCATLAHTVDGAVVDIEGDPRSPIDEGTLCPKGAAIYQLHINPNRPTQVLHRAPGAIGLALKRQLLARAVADDPAPEAFEAWLLAQYLAAGIGCGPWQAMAFDVLREWQLAQASPAFQAWLHQGAPSDDAQR
jgi:anaerobic selenocysteine-containing dehydrogenase